MTRRAALIAATAGVALLGAATPAATAATTYRYWTYWTGSAATWTFSPVGPASVVPADGDVQGWRFAVTQGVRGQGNEPRIGVADAFQKFCSGRAAGDGEKRVAVVIDFGEPSDSPPGQSPPAPRGVCVVAPQSANGAVILSRAATVRTDRGLVCAIAGFPQGECAPAIADETSPPPTRSSDRSSDRPSREPEPAPTPSNHPSPSSTPQDAPSPAAPPREKKSAARVRASSEPDTRPKTLPSTTPSLQTTPGLSTAEPTPSEGTVFVAADSVTTADQGGSWLPIAGVAALVLAIGGFVWWRRRA